MSNKPQLSRSEIARLRRAQRTVKELEQTSKRALKPVVPVVSRQAKVTGGLKLRRVQSHRRFNIALGLPEIHLHRPTFHLPSLRTGWRLVSLLTALFLGVAIYLLLTLPYFHIPSVTVLGNNRLTREEITAVAGVIGQSIFTVQPQEAATRLRMNYPELASVEVNAYLPNHIYVTVSERVPVIFWQQGEGYTWIDSQGVAFRPRGVATGLVAVKGATNPPAGIAPVDDPASPPPFMQKELVDAILALAPNVPADSTMVFDPKDGLGWTDSRGWKVFFGASAHDMPLKVRVYQSLVDSLVSRGKSPIFISVVYPDAPFYRMAETTPEETTATADSGN
jgi:hypothetical protein